MTIATQLEFAGSKGPVSKAAVERFHVSAEVLERLQILEAYDLSFLTNHFHEGELREFSPEQLFPLIRHFGKHGIKVDLAVAQRLEREFKRFVALALVRPSRRNAPSGPVDMYWHFFVLHTPEYVEFSTRIFGDYGPQPRLTKHYFQDVADKRAAMVDHIPATDETRPMMYEVYQQTRAMYKELFGEPDSLYWPEPTGPKQVTCGDSYSGFIAPILSVLNKT
ncbi:MAG: hypothetical protein QOG31_392 [Thermoplasmata archaeon]|nr:hypothetical protein [Thermoplasmata archaeon]